MTLPLRRIQILVLWIAALIASFDALSGPPALAAPQAATAWSNPDGSSGPYAGWTPQALASGGGTLQLQWANTNGQLSLWRLNAATGAFRIQSYGPYSPWTPQSLAAGPDGKADVLWTTPAGAASLWTVAADGSFTNQNYGPYAGWTARQIVVDPTGTVHVAWTNINGQLSLWTVSRTGSFVTQNYGPYAGWSFQRLAAAPGGHLRVLWSQPSRQISLWDLSPSGGMTHSEFGPYAGWTTVGLTVDSAGMARLLWQSASGQAALWQVQADGSFHDSYYTAPAGYAARDVCPAPGGGLALLWTKADGTAQVRTIGDDGTDSPGGLFPAPISLSVAPASVTGGAAATGTVTLARPAVTGGIVVSLAVDGPLAGVPATVTVPEGASSAAFPITTSRTGGGGAVQVTATADGGAQSAKMTVTPPATTAQSLTLTPATVTGGGAATGTVTLTQAAPAGGATVKLSSDSPLAAVPASIAVPAGAATATFSVTTTSPGADADGTAHLTASFGGVSPTATLAITRVVPVPATGVYRLTTRGQQGLALDVTGFQVADRTPVQLWTAGQTCNQQWRVEKQADGSYKISPYSGSYTNQVLDLDGGNTANGTTVQTFSDNGNSAQRWLFAYVGNGFYRIIPQNAGAASLQTLDVRGGNSAAAGSTLNVYNYYSGDNQVFRLDAPGPAQPTPGVYRIATRGHPELSLDVVGFGNANGTNVQLWTANQTSNQQWRINTIGGNVYTIAAYSALNSLQMLDCAGGQTANGTNVTTWEDTGSVNQQWQFGDIGGGYSRIIPLNAGPNGTATLDVRGGGNAGPNSTLNIYGYYGGDNQVFALTDPGPAATLVNARKGLAGHEGYSAQMGASWCYNWGSNLPGGLPASVEFVPMQWGYYGGNNTDWLNSVKTATNAKNFLAFNEPDGADQANLSVADALTGYQYMAGLGMPIVSPACVHADDQWMQDFMAGANARGYRVDAVAIHWYGGNDVNGFLGYIDYIHNLYGRDVWITEFAPADWSGNRGISPQQEADFMRAVLPALNSRPYVKRYAWYGAAGTGDAALGAAAFWNDDGSLTALGKLYSRL